LFERVVEQVAIFVQMDVGVDEHVWVLSLNVIDEKSLRLANGSACNPVSEAVSIVEGSGTTGGRYEVCFEA
jgi:hypothetical protein